MRYVDVDDVSVAYQVVEGGEHVVLGIPGFAQNIDLLWGEPHARRFFERFSTMATLVHYDKRGTGLSDRSVPPPVLHERVAEALAVMDAAGVERAVLAGFSEGATLAAYLAATHPERATGLMVAGGFASFVARDDHPWAPSPDEAVATFELTRSVWGDGVIAADWYAPSMSADSEFRQWAGRYERQSIHPGRIIDYARYMLDLDIRSVLSQVRVPTVVLHAAGDRMVPKESGRYLADHIPGAKFVEVDGDDHAIFYGNQDAWLEAMSRFLTGDAEPVPSQRRLATVLFTDIVGSTERAAELGDASWRGVLDDHDRLADQAVRREGGRVVKSTGDGVLAVFDSPTPAVRAAAELLDAVERSVGLQLRAGVHCGEVEIRGDDVAGLAVNLAARIESVAAAGGIMASRTVKELAVGSGLYFSDRGEHELKGIPDVWQLFDVSRP